MWVSMFQLELCLLGATVLQRKCVFDYEWKGVPEPSSAIWKKGFGLAFLLHRKVGHREGGRENPYPLQLRSSNAGATWNCCAHANATAEPGLGHIKCWPTAEFFPVSRALCDHKAFHEWGKRPKLCIAGLEAVWESWVELGWDLTGI